MVCFPSVGRRISVQGFQLTLDGNETWWDHSGGNKSWTLELKVEPSLVFTFHCTAETGSTHFDITLHEQTLVVTVTLMVPGFGTFVLWGFVDWFRAFLSFFLIIIVMLLVLRFTVFTSVSFSVKLLCVVSSNSVFVTSWFNLTDFFLSRV